MNPTPFNQILSNNQKEIIAGVVAIIVAIIGGVFLLISTCMNKETPAPAAKNYNYAPTYITINVAAAPSAPQVAPARKAPQPRKQYRKPITKPQPQPSCPCADSTKTSA